MRTWGSWHVLIVLVRCADICAADSCDGLRHIPSVHSVVVHTVELAAFRLPGRTADCAAALALFTGPAARLCTWQKMQIGKGLVHFP